MMYNDITIAITSCGRFELLKQTIDSISISVDLSPFKKIMTEDSKDQKHIDRMKDANMNGFLKGWKILFTKGSGQNDVLKSHYFALKTLYDNIDTKYTFHCEDDQLFYKTDYDYIDLSYKILENNKNIALVTLRDLYKDYGIQKEGIMKSRYYDILTDEEKDFYGHRFIYGNKNSIFNLQPGLRNTDEVKKAMFGFEETINETYVSQRLSDNGLTGIYIKEGIYYNPDRRRNSTRNIKTMGFKKYVLETAYNAIKYRIGLFRKYFKDLFINTFYNGK